MDGVIQKYLDLRGYGFVLVDFRTRYFFHVSQWKGGVAPKVGQHVRFDVAPARKEGQNPQAVNVAPVDGVA